MFRSVSTLLALSFVAGCASTNVTTDFDPSASFTSYRTYTWMPEPTTVNDVRLTGELVDRRIRSAIEGALNEKGLQKVESGGDLMIGYHAALDEKIDVTTVNSMWGPGWRYPSYWGARDVYTNEYTEGTLVVDIFDAESKAMVWRGVGEGRINPDDTMEDRQDRLNSAARDILADFPPGS